MSVLGRSSRSATPCWNAENMRLLTVFEPAMNAPNAPVTPANSGQTPPTWSDTHSAMASGMARRSAEFIPELM